MPFAVENHSPFPHFAFLKSGPDGSDFHVLAVRATFEWTHDGEMPLASPQDPVVVADEVAGPDDARELVLGAYGYGVGHPAPVASVPLSYRVAFGGTRRRGSGDRVEEDVFEANPIGVGYKGRFAIDEPIWPAPQIEPIDAPVRSPSD